MTAEDTVEGPPEVTVITTSAPEAEASQVNQSSRAGVPLRTAVASALSTTMDRISTAMETLWNPPWNTIRDVMMDPRRGSLINSRRRPPSTSHSSSNSRHDSRSTGWRGSFAPSTPFLPPPHCHAIRRSDHNADDTSSSSVVDDSAAASRQTSLSSAPLLTSTAGVTSHASSGTHCPSLPSCLFRGSSGLSSQDQGYSVLNAGSQTSLPRDAVNPSSTSYLGNNNSCRASSERSSSSSCPQSSHRRSSRSRQSSYRRSSSRFHSVYQDYFDSDDGRDKNFLSALLSILVIATLATALTQPKWFSIRGGVCGRKFIGLQLFIELNSRTTNSVNTHVVSKGNTEVPDEANYMNRNGGSFKLSSRDDDTNDQDSESDATEPLPKPESSMFSPFDPASVAVFPSSFDKIINQTLIQSGIKLDANETEHFFKIDPIPNKKTGHPIKKTKKKEHEAESASAMHDRKPKSCSYPDILPLQRMIILLCLVAIMMNLSQFFLDTLGTSKKLLNLLRLHGVGSILGVILTIIIIGFSYMIAAMLELDERSAMTQISSNRDLNPFSGHAVATSLTKETTLYPNPQHLEVRFELSYYLITLSGLIGLMAAASNLLRKPTTPFVFPSHSLLLDPLLFADTEDSRNPIWTGSSSRLPRLITGLPPPPPPYSP